MQVPIPDVYGAIATLVEDLHAHMSRKSGALKTASQDRFWPVEFESQVKAS